MQRFPAEMDANGQTAVTVAVSDDRTAVDNLVLSVASDNPVLFPDGAIVIGDTGPAKEQQSVPASGALSAHGRGVSLCNGFARDGLAIIGPTTT